MIRRLGQSWRAAPEPGIVLVEPIVGIEVANGAIAGALYDGAEDLSMIATQRLQDGGHEPVLNAQTQHPAAERQI
jgi:hypothetical protein